MIDLSNNIAIKDDKLNEVWSKAMDTIPRFDTDQETIYYFLDLTSEYRFKIVTPFALSADGWEDWKIQLAAKFPIRTFIQETIPQKWKDIAGYKIKHTWRDLYWGFKHRYIKRHQYNVLRPKTLEPGYYDPDIRILHACMEDLREFYDRGATQVDWDSNEYHNQVYKEMTAIYTWWTKEYPTREQEWEKANPYPQNIPWKRLFSNGKHDNDADVIEYRRVAELHRKIEEKWAQDEEDMLIRLVKIRRSLWYP